MSEIPSPLRERTLCRFMIIQIFMYDIKHYAISLSQLLISYQLIFSLSLSLAQDGGAARCVCACVSIENRYNRSEGGTERLS
jgi:hypothetical protein